jgi:hypothetical protein
MPEHDVEWHLQELARRVMERPNEREEWSTFALVCASGSTPIRIWNDR